jgi:hypothetical protein
MLGDLLGHRGRGGALRKPFDGEAAERSSKKPRISLITRIGLAKTSRGQKRAGGKYDLIIRVIRGYVSYSATSSRWAAASSNLQRVVAPTTAAGKPRATTRDDSLALVIGPLPVVACAR